MRRKNERKGTWRLSSWDPGFKGHVKSEINLQHYCVVEDNMVRYIVIYSQTCIKRPYMT